MRKLGLALGGGGAKGIAHLAFLDKLDEMGIVPVAVSGTSMGAIIGAIYCSGMKAKDMMAYLAHMDEDASSGRKRRLLLRLSTASPSYRGVFMKRMVESMLPVKTFEELKIPLKIIAVDFYTLEEKVFSSGSLVDAVMASAALPRGVYPYKIGEHYYIDGGAINIVPANVIKDDCDVLVAIDVSSIVPTDPDKKPTGKHARTAMIVACSKALLAYKMQEAGTDLFYKVIFDNIGTLDFHKYKEAYEVGQKYTNQFEKDLKDKLFLTRRKWLR